MAVVCAVAVLVFVFVVVLRKEPFADPNQVVLIRLVLSLAISIIGAVVPGFLRVDLKARGVAIRAGGALGLFVLSFFFTPKVILTTDPAGDDSGINRILTKFEKVYVQAVFELPKENASILRLKESILEVIHAVYEEGQTSPEGFYTSNTQRPGVGAQLLPVIHIELHDILSEDYIRLSQYLLESQELLRFLQVPRLKIGVNKEPRKSDELIGSFIQLADPPDFYASVHSPPVDPDQGHFGKLIFDRNLDRLLVYWNGFDFPNKHWMTNSKILSVEDLGGSQLITMLDKAGNIVPKLDSVSSAMVPEWINIHFDNHVVTFQDFEATSRVIEWQVYYATFPESKLILDNKTNINFKDYFLSGF